MRLIDVDALKEKEQYIPLKHGLMLHGVTAATIDAMPTIDPGTLPLVQELQTQVKEQKEQLAHLEYWELDRKQVLKSAAGDRAAVKTMQKHCEKTIDELRAELKRVKAERDAAIEDIPKICKTCKYGKSPCDWCVYDPDGELNWEWRGLVEENATAESEVQANDRP